MKVEVPFGEGKETVEVPDDAIGEIVFPNELPDNDEESLLLDALSNPIGSVRLSEFLQGAKDVVVIVNDATRPTPTAKVIDQIYPHLEGFDFKIVVATGMHRAPTEEEYRFVLGDRYDDLMPHQFPGHQRMSCSLSLCTSGIYCMECQAHLPYNLWPWPVSGQPRFFPPLLRR